MSCLYVFTEVIKHEKHSWSFFSKYNYIISLHQIYCALVVTTEITYTSVAEVIYLMIKFSTHLVFQILLCIDILVASALEYILIKYFVRRTYSLDFLYNTQNMG